MWHEPATRDDVTIDTRQPITDRPGAWVTLDEFRVGMTCGDVRPYAQPVVDLVSGRLVGYRGLARWHHRRLGMLNAEAFIGMIAETPLASQVDLYVARETAAALTFTTRGDERPRLYTPVSRRLIVDVRTEQYLSEIADAFCLTTEPAVPTGRSTAARRMVTVTPGCAAISSRGRHHARTHRREDVSDAEHLAERGFHELHLSLGLTNAAATELDALRSVTELVRRAHDLGLLVAATGVNREQHRAALVETGCDLASGDLYGAPMPADTIE